MSSLRSTDDHLLPRTTARDERTPTGETAIVLIGFFLIQFPLSALGLVGLFALGPLVVVKPWTLVTSVYSHGGPIHLLGNLLALGIFGYLVERITTRLRFHAFFLLTGALAGLAEVILGSLFALSPRGVLGASGAIFALIGYTITGNGLANRLLQFVSRSTDADWIVAALLVTLAAVGAVLLSGPGTAVVAHGAGLALGLFAGRVRLLHVDRRGNRGGRGNDTVTIG